VITPIARHEPDCGGAFDSQIAAFVAERKWYAVFTLPQNEKSTTRHLALRDVETFLPSYEVAKLWKNRQRVTSVRPLFPSYVFVRICKSERVRVLQCPGVLYIVGNGRNESPLTDTEVEFLRSGLAGRPVEPFSELAAGDRVRIKSGMLRGIEGTLVRKSSSLRFVLTISLINQSAAVEINADALESVFMPT
jgi:transcription antitermination factor NusG